MKPSGMLLASALLFAPGTAEAASVLSQFGGSACYARFYDAGHLARHPDQSVRRISLSRSRELTDERRTVLTVRVQFRHSGEVYTGEAYCSPRGNGAACGLEGDWGEFSLGFKGSDLRMSVARAGFEGATDSPEFGADDRVFLLRKAASARCF